jgi:hypothetical protein
MGNYVDGYAMIMLLFCLCFGATCGSRDFCFRHADKRSSIFLLLKNFFFFEGEKCQITFVKTRITQIGAGTRHNSPTRCHMH